MPPPRPLGESVMPDGRPHLGPSTRAAGVPNRTRGDRVQDGPKHGQVPRGKLRFFPRARAGLFGSRPDDGGDRGVSGGIHNGESFPARVVRALGFVNRTNGLPLRVHAASGAREPPTGNPRAVFPAISSGHVASSVAKAGKRLPHRSPVKSRRSTRPPRGSRRGCAGKAPRRLRRGARRTCRASRPGLRR